MKRAPLLIFVFVCLLMNFAHAEEPLTELLVDVRINASGAITLPDGTFILAGNDGMISEIQPAKAVSISPFGKMNWEVLDSFDGKSSNSYGCVTALSSDKLIVSNFSISDTNAKNILTEIKDGKVYSRIDLHDPMGGSIYVIDDGFICETVSKVESVIDQDDITFPCLTRYDHQLNVVWSKSYEKPFSGMILTVADEFYLVGSCSYVPEDKYITTHGYVAKMNAHGDIEWEQTLPGNYFGFSNGLVTGDGSLVVVGGLKTGDSSNDAVIAEFSSGGDLVWRKDYTIDDVRFNAIVSVEQGYLTAGISHRDENNFIILSLFNREGNMLKQWQIAETMERPTSVSLHTTPYGTYLVASVRESSSYGRKYKTLIKLIEMEELPYGAIPPS